MTPPPGRGETQAEARLGTGPESEAQDPDSWGLWLASSARGRPLPQAPDAPGAKHSLSSWPFPFSSRGIFLYLHPNKL